MDLTYALLLLAIFIGGAIAAAFRLARPRSQSLEDIRDEGAYGDRPHVPEGLGEASGTAFVAARSSRFASRPSGLQSSRKATVQTLAGPVATEILHSPEDKP